MKWQQLWTEMSKNIYFSSQTLRRRLRGSERGRRSTKTVEQKVSSAKTPLKQRRHQGWSWQHICISSNQTRSAPQSHIFTPNKATFAPSYFSLRPNFCCRLQQLFSSVLFVTVSTATHMSPIRSHKSQSRKGCGTTCARPDLFEAICKMS